MLSLIQSETQLYSGNILQCHPYLAAITCSWGYISVHNIHNIHVLPSYNISIKSCTQQIAVETDKPIYLY